MSIEDLPTKRDAQVECLLKEDEPFIPPDHSNTPRREGKDLMEKEETQKDVVQSKNVIINDDHPDQPITIDGNLLAECRKELTKTLWNLEAYVDYMVIKSKTKQYLVWDVKETLSAPKKLNMKLDPKKCSSGMEEGKFLRYIVTSKGIRTRIESVQQKGNSAYWTDSAEEAFQNMKRLVAELPTPTTPIKGEELMVYLSTADEAVSAVLLDERSVSRMSIPPGNRRWLTKWVVESGAYDISYITRSVINGQVLVDFMADTITKPDPAIGNVTNKKDILESSSVKAAPMKEDPTPGLDA
ncbi:hypothetical protein Tco_0591663 [Tanacetum coccineum]